MKTLGALFAFAILLGAATSHAEPPAAAIRASLMHAFPGARVAYDPTQGLRRISGLKQDLGTGTHADHVRTVLERVAPATWPGIALQAGEVRIEPSRRFTRVEAPLLYQGRPIVDAVLTLEFKSFGILSAIGANLGPIGGVSTTSGEASDDTMRIAACVAVRAERPAAPCPRQVAVRRAWYRSSDGTLKAGALVTMPSPGLDHVPEVLLDASGEAVWTRDRVRH